MASSNPLKVLAVDDNAANLKLACILLEDLGCEVTSARSGEQAVALVRGQTFDLILMDLQMPGMNGIEATRQIRKSEAGGHRTPIVALTAHIMPEEIESLQAAGLDDQIIKPINDAQIHSIVQKWAPAYSRGAAGDAGAVPAPKPESEKQRIVDWELGYQLAHGNRELAKEMMNLLLATLPRDTAAIHLAYDQGNREALRNAVHHLNGAVRYCGVPQLRSCISELETAVRREDNGQIAPAMRQFHQAVKDLQAWA